MRNEHIIRAWKDEGFREGLSPEARAHLPEHPAGMVELTDADLMNAAGGDITISLSATITVSLTLIFSCFD